MPRRNAKARIVHKGYAKRGRHKGRVRDATRHDEHAAADLLDRLKRAA